MQLPDADQTIRCHRRTSVQPATERKILCVYPRYPAGFSTFQHSYALMPGIRAFMTPLGLLTIASYLPKEWQVRFVDENDRQADERDYAWADAVLISGMHVQRKHIQRINDTAHRFGKMTVLGGPSVSACPDYYPDVDILHLGELGDATDALVERLDADLARPPKQMRLQTSVKLPMERFPVPAYHLIDVRRYFVTSIQASSGCPYRCEFCDVPGLYGRAPRSKSPEQVLAELDTILEVGSRGPVYFIDDDFISSPQNAKRLLPYLVEWQRSRGYPFEFICEATLPLAQHQDVLELMREAWFTTVFCGVESPEPQTLRAIHKEHNLRKPIVDAIRTMNSYGLEVAGGVILGFDTDTPQTPNAVIDLVRETKIPLLTINLLYALPNSPLYNRLREEGRLVDDLDRESNIAYRLPHDVVLAGWRKCLQDVYSPPNLLERYAYQAEHTYPNRLPRPKVGLRYTLFGLRVIVRVLWRVGCLSDYRRDYLRVARPLVSSGRVAEALHIGFASYHLINFARDCASGGAEPSLYADPSRSSFNRSYTQD